jgi:hypothetical protein
VVAGDPRRVDPGRKRQCVKPQRNRIADTLGVRSRRADRQHVGDHPLGTGGLGNRLHRLNRVCAGCQRINSSLSFTSRPRELHSLTPAARDRPTAPTPRAPRDRSNLSLIVQGGNAATLDATIAERAATGGDVPVAPAGARCERSGEHRLDTTPATSPPTIPVQFTIWSFIRGNAQQQRLREILRKAGHHRSLFPRFEVSARGLGSSASAQAAGRTDRDP